MRLTETSVTVWVTRVIWRTHALVAAGSVDALSTRSTRECLLFALIYIATQTIRSKDESSRTYAKAGQIIVALVYTLLILRTRVVCGAVDTGHCEKLKLVTL